MQTLFMQKQAFNFFKNESSEMTCNCNLTIINAMLKSKQDKTIRTNCFKIEKQKIKLGS